MNLSRRLFLHSGLATGAALAVAPKMFAEPTLPGWHVGYANAPAAGYPQAPMTLAAGEMTKAKESTSDTWITTKVKADLLTEKVIPGSDIKVETNKGVVALSGVVASDAERELAMAKAGEIKGVTAVSADGLKTSQ